MQIINLEVGPMMWQGPPKTPPRPQQRRYLRPKMLVHTSPEALRCEQRDDDASEGAISSEDDASELDAVLLGAGLLGGLVINVSIWLQFYQSSWER